MSSGAPVGGDLCGSLPDGRLKAEVYRSPLDIALEIMEIQSFNSSEHGFEVFGFVPANEANLEWYTGRPHDGGWPDGHNIVNPESWSDMDSYFATLYDHVQNLEDIRNVNARVLTPTMTQNFFAEGLDFFHADESTGLQTCTERFIDVNGVNAKGYELMPQTYGTTKNDGVAWHNYWIIDHEIFNTCENGGGHVSFYFPTEMREAIHSFYRPPLILEADLGSPKIGELSERGQVPISLTDMLDKDADPARTSNSIRHFMHSEACFGANDYEADPDLALWLLSDNVLPGNPEHDWHEAYRDGPIERAWFTQWWTNDSEIYYDCPDFRAVPTAITLEAVEAQNEISSVKIVSLLLIGVIATVTVKWAMNAVNRKRLQS